MSIFDGIDRGVATDSMLANWRSAATESFTIDMFEDAIRRMKEVDARPPVELHSPRCPKVTSDGKRACRCACGNPIEGIFEDELARMAKERS